MTGRIVPLEPARFAEVWALLEAAALPVSDLDPAALPAFLVAAEDGDLTGVVAVEVLGGEGLLRSLAVRPDLRGRGLGQRLLIAAESYARNRGVQVLYLFTTTAEGFFPASAAFMWKRVGGSGAVPWTSGTGTAEGKE